MGRGVWIIFSIVVVLVFVFGGVFLFKHLNQSGNNNLNPQQNNSQNSVFIASGVVDANNQFAMDLYLNYKSKEENMFFSPYSISSALAMTYEGAKGKTAQEIQEVLHLPLKKDKIRADFISINSQLNKANRLYKLSVANALWAQKDYAFLDEYFSVVEDYYDGKVTNLDFYINPETSRVTINNWVENKTNYKLKELIPPGMINSMTRLVLTNAIYFKANWSKQFDAEDTANGQFKLNSNSNISVEMMYQENEFNYGETKDIQILEMDYVGEDIPQVYADSFEKDISMLVILPKKNNLEEIENTISKSKIMEWKRSMNIQEVFVGLPKFKFETKYYMAEDFKKMGMPSAFSDGADFSGMTGKQDLVISEVIHQTLIEVAEAGTEASAATAVVIMEISAGLGQETEPKKFIANHPFIFIIQQKESGNILFIGRVSNPEKFL